MKKLLLALIIFITPVRAFALQDYVIFADYDVKSIAVDDKSIIDIFPVQTIDNSKKTLLLQAKKEGKTFVTIKTTHGESIIKVKINHDETQIKCDDSFNFVPADIPPENLLIDGVDILLPPNEKGGK